MNNELWYPSKITPSRHFVYLTSLEKDNPELYQMAYDYYSMNGEDDWELYNDYFQNAISFLESACESERSKEEAFIRAQQEDFPFLKGLSPEQLGSIEITKKINEIYVGTNLLEQRIKAEKERIAKGLKREQEGATRMTMSATSQQNFKRVLTDVDAFFGGRSRAQSKNTKITQAVVSLIQKNLTEKGTLLDFFGNYANEVVFASTITMYARDAFKTEEGQSIFESGKNLEDFLMTLEPVQRLMNLVTNASKNDKTKQELFSTLDKMRGILKIDDKVVQDLNKPIKFAKSPLGKMKQEILSTAVGEQVGLRIQFATENIRGLGAEAMDFMQQRVVGMMASELGGRTFGAGKRQGLTDTFSYLIKSDVALELSDKDIKKVNRIIENSMKKVGKEERQKFIENAAYEQKVLDKLDEFFKERKAGVTQIFQIHSSVKDYINIDSTKSKFNKFEGGQSWSVGDFGKILNDLYLLGFNGYRADFLKSAIINSIPGAIGRVNLYGLQRYLSLFAFILLFSDGYNIVKDTQAFLAQQASSTVKSIHLFYTNGFYVTVSTLLRRLINELRNFESETNVQITIQPMEGAYKRVQEMVAMGVPSKERWNTLGKEAFEKTKLKVTFLAKFFDFLESLG